jgi:RHS repeat-associated protein
VNPHLFIHGQPTPRHNHARYDGDGHRVKKSNGKLYWYGMDSDPLSESDLTGNITDDYIFFKGKRIARQNISSGNRFFYFSDHLGTTRIIAQAGISSACYDADFYPFGGEAVIATNTYPQNYKFTGKERDSESNLDNFGARFDSSSLGRFMSADPVNITPGRLRDPQQLNLYSYARNNPLRFVDPDGEILQLSGDVNEAQKQLCDIIGGDCSRISYDDKTNTITVDLTGIDLSQNEGASLINSLVDSSNVYNLNLGDTVQTAGGPLSLSGDNSIANLDRNPDDRCASKGKGAKDLPAKGIDDQIAINPKDAVFRDSQGRLVPLSSLIFHELAEAYAKIDGGKAYGDFQTLGVVGGAIAIGLPQQGAHNEAIQRELTLRSQRPYMNFSGRAGDFLIRQPKPPRPQ